MRTEPIEYDFINDMETLSIVMHVAKAFVHLHCHRSSSCHSYHSKAVDHGGFHASQGLHQSIVNACAIHSQVTRSTSSPQTLKDAISHRFFILSMLVFDVLEGPESSCSLLQFQMNIELTNAKGPISHRTLIQTILCHFITEQQINIELTSLKDFISHRTFFLSILCC